MTDKTATTPTLPTSASATAASWPLPLDPEARSDAATWAYVLRPEHNGLLRAQARRYEGPLLPQQALLQVGRIGLFRAAKRFNPSQGVAFSIYARWWVRSELQGALKDAHRGPKVGARLRRGAARFRRLTRSMPVEELERLDAEALAKLLGCHPGTAARVPAFLAVQLCSLDAPVGGEGAEGGRRLLDNIPGDSGGEDEALEALEQRVREALLAEGLEKLQRYNPGWHHLLVHHFGLLGHPSQQAATIARGLGISHQSVSQRILRGKKWLAQWVRQHRDQSWTIYQRREQALEAERAAKPSLQLVRRPPSVRHEDWLLPDTLPEEPAVLARDEDLDATDPDEPHEAVA